MMLHPSSRSERHATLIVSKCRQNQPVLVQYNNKCKRGLGTAHSPTRQQHSPEFQTHLMQTPKELQVRQNLRIDSSYPIQSVLYDNSDRGFCLSFSQECCSGSILGLKRGSAVSKDVKVAENLIRLFTKRRKNDMTMRIFRHLISRRDDLDDNSLHNLLLAADKIIFCGRLCGRVRWEWSKGQPEYEHELLGTTALRPADSSIGGFETLIVLSRPLLQNERFSRDLLLSAFLHELIHSYFFIQCGLEHAKDDGHTLGFRKIAELIDTEFGQQRLHLCNMRANLDHFLIPKIPDDAGNSRSLKRQFTAWPASLKTELYCNSLQDEGYLSRDRSPNAEFSSDIAVDEGYKSRGQSPGFSGSLDPTDYCVVMQTRDGHSESHWAQNALHLATTHSCQSLHA